MSTTVTITVEDHHATIFGKSSGVARTNITITRQSKAHAIAEALTMTAAAHRAEFEQTWAEILGQVEPLLAAHRSEVEGQHKVAEAEEASQPTLAADRTDSSPA